MKPREETEAKREFAEGQRVWCYYYDYEFCKDGPVLGTCKRPGTYSDGWYVEVDKTLQTTFFADGHMIAAGERYGITSARGEDFKLKLRTANNGPAPGDIELKPNTIITVEAPDGRRICIEWETGGPAPTPEMLRVIEKMLEVNNG